MAIDSDDHKITLAVDSDVQEMTTVPDSQDESIETMLAQALKTTAGIRIDRSEVNELRVEAEKRRELAEAEASRVLDELFTEANTVAQTIIEDANAIKREAEMERARAHQETEEAARITREADARRKLVEAEAAADRARAHQEVKETEAARAEAERRLQEIVSEANNRAEQTTREALDQAQEQITVLRRRAEEEVRKLLDEAATFYASVVDDTEARRILSHAERIRSQASGLRIRYLGSGHGEA